MKSQRISSIGIIFCVVIICLILIIDIANSKDQNVLDQKYDEALYLVYNEQYDTHAGVCYDPISATHLNTLYTRSAILGSPSGGGAREF